MERAFTHSTVLGASAPSRPRERRPATRARGVTVVEAALIAALAVALVVGAAFSGGTHARPERLMPVWVETGDSLWSLARAHPIEGLGTAETAELLAEINRLEDPSLRVGAEILVPAPATLSTAHARR